MSRKALAAIVGIVVVMAAVAFIAWLVLRSEPASACPLPFLVDNGEKRASFEAKLDAGSKVEGAAAAFVKDPEIQNLLNDKQNQLQLGDYLYCMAGQRKEFQLGTDLAAWFEKRYHFLATGPSAEEMERWEKANPRPDVKRAQFSVSGLAQQQDHWSPIEWQGTLAWFSLANVGADAGQIVFQNLPRRDYMVLADEAELLEDIVPIPAGKTRRIRLVQLFAGLAAAREFVMRAGGDSYRIVLHPPPLAQAARPQQAALTQFTQSLDGAPPSDAGQTYAAMLRAVNSKNPAAGPAAPLIAGDLLASLGLGEAAALAYDKAGLRALGERQPSPGIDYRLARVRHLRSDRRVISEISIPSGDSRPVALDVKAFDRHVLAVTAPVFAGQLKQSVAVLEAADPGAPPHALERQLRTQAKISAAAAARRPEG